MLIFILLIISTLIGLVFYFYFDFMDEIVIIYIKGFKDTCLEVLLLESQDIFRLLFRYQSLHNNGFLLNDNDRRILSLFLFWFLFKSLIFFII